MYLIVTNESLVNTTTSSQSLATISPIIGSITPSSGKHPLIMVEIKKRYRFFTETIVIIASSVAGVVLALIVLLSLILIVTLIRCKLKWNKGEATITSKSML